MSNIVNLSLVQLKLQLEKHFFSFRIFSKIQGTSWYQNIALSLLQSILQNVQRTSGEKVVLVRQLRCKLVYILRSWDVDRSICLSSVEHVRLVMDELVLRTWGHFLKWDLTMKGPKPTRHKPYPNSQHILGSPNNLRPHFTSG